MEIFSGRNSNHKKTAHLTNPHFQQLLGFCPDDYESELNDQVLDKNQKEFIYKTCINQGETGKIRSNVVGSDLSLLTVVTMQEARLQAEIVYALLAVTQFLHW